jgi:hypothetical protein
MHTCSWFSSNEHLVTVTTPLYRATMWFCTEHKLAQEANFARRVPGQRRSLTVQTEASTKA